jgi:alpha-L-rhamnosidase
MSEPTSSGPQPSPPAAPVLVTNVAAGLLTAGAEPVRLSWRLPAGAGVQTRYEVQSAADAAFGGEVATSGPVGSADQVEMALPGGPLGSREVRHARVRVDTGAGWTPWSAPVTVEAGLLAPSDWSAVAITLAGDEGAHRQAPAPLLRTTFTLDAAPVRARLHVTSRGLHRMLLNGAPVTENLLDPGWSAYHARLLVSTHDVTALVRQGTNAVGAMLGDGWFRGRLGWDPVNARCRDGDTLALLAQLEVDLADGSRVVVGTDGGWRAATGEVLVADLYDGCDVDLRLRPDGWDRPGFDDSGWSPAAVVPLDLATLEPQVAPPVRQVARFDVTPVAGPPGTTRLDAGQNVSGWVRLVVRGAAGQTVTVRHAEVLEADGGLHTVSLRSARATDTYVLADGGENTLEPVFTFHGFQHAEVTTDAEVLSAQVVAISSATVERGRFECSDPTLNRFVENVRWSQRDNFVAVPTDCPQRDERLGWTGDAQAFAATACTLFDARAFWTGWLRDLAHDQARDGAVGSVVPNILGEGPFALGRAGWADAATIVPWAVHEAYGDTDVLRAQLPSMVAHVAYLTARRHDDGLLAGEFQYGDWLDPDAPGDQPWKAKCDSDFLANAFLAHSARLVARAATVLDEPDVAGPHAALADEVADLTWRRWSGHAPTTQTGCAVALCLDLAPEPERAALGAALAALVRDAAGRIATGFLGTPLVLPALTATGHLEEAYAMLLRREMPSWLYQVDRGATTVWERWDAIAPDGTIHDGVMHMPDGDGQMLSFNHYAYGAVADWVFRSLAGLAPDVDAPGYRHVVLAPYPVTGIGWVRASVQTGYGPVAASWQVDDDGAFHAEYGLPPGTSATFTPPASGASTVLLDGAEVTSGGALSLGPGRHAVTVTRARVVAPASARVSA